MPETQKKQIMIVTHNQGGVSYAFAAALAETFASRPAQLIWHPTPTTDKNVLLPMIDRSDVDIVVWIDPNIVWNAEQFDEIVSPVMKGDTKVAGCLHHAQSRDASGGLYPVGLEFLDQDLDPARGYVGPMRESGSSMYLRVKRMPFSFLAIDRSTLLAAVHEADEYTLHNEAERSTWRVFESYVFDDELISEDHAACDRLRAVEGVEIWVSMDHAVLSIIGGHAIGRPGEPPRIHEFAADAAKAKR